MRNPIFSSRGCRHALSRQYVLLQRGYGSTVLERRARTESVVNAENQIHTATTHME